MKISYVVATFNCINHIETFAKTVEMLERLGCEICVSDGGSSDGTTERLRELKGIKLVRSAPDQGIYEAWNWALEHATGEFVGFFGVDDIPSPDFISSAQAAVRNRRHVPMIIYGDRILVNGQRVRFVRSPNRPRIFRERTSLVDIPHQGCLHHASLFETARFDSSYRLAGDLKFYLENQYKLDCQNVVRIPLPQVASDANGMSRSAQSFRVYLEEYTRIEEELSINLDYSAMKLRTLALLSKFPGWLSCTKRVMWWIRGKKVRAPLCEADSYLSYFTSLTIGRY